MNRPEEPISLSAPLARRMAGQLCRKDPVSGENCAWYHGLWQDLRSIGLAASPEHQADFFLGAFREIAKRPGQRRVLISGAADYSILAHVLWACCESGVDVQVTVIDRCETPLFLNRWYAERAGQTITTVCADIFQHHADERFDIICSHSFLGQFPAEGRQALMEKWLGLLTTEGLVMAVNRVRPAEGPKEVRFSADEGRTFCATVSERIGTLPALVPVERDEILRRARMYVERSLTHAIAPEEIVSLFERNGFEVDAVSSIVSTDPQNREIAGKAIPKDAKHACVVARKAGIREAVAMPMAAS